MRAIFYIRFIIILFSGVTEAKSPYCMEGICIGDKLIKVKEKGYEKFGNIEWVKDFSKVFNFKMKDGRTYKILHLVRTRKGEVCDLRYRFYFENLELDEIDSLVTQKTGHNYNLTKTYTRKVWNYQPESKERETPLPRLSFRDRNSIVFNSLFGCEDVPKDFP